MLAGVLSVLESAGKLKAVGEPGHIYLISIDGTPFALEEGSGGLAGRRDLAAAQPLRQIWPRLSAGRGRRQVVRGRTDRSRQPDRGASTAIRWTCCRRRWSPRPTSTTRRSGAIRSNSARWQHGHPAPAEPARAEPARGGSVRIAGRRGDRRLEALRREPGARRRLAGHPGRRFAGAGRPQRRRQVDAGRRADRAAGARCRPGPPRRRGRARPRRPPGLARAGRLRLSEVDRDPDPHGRREPVPQRASDLRRRLDRLAGAAPAGASGCSRTGASRSTSNSTPSASRSSSARSSRSRARSCRAPASSSWTSRPPSSKAREVARLFERIVRLQEGGVTFLYISHHLEEIYEVCRSVTVLRDGAGGRQRAARDDAQGPRGRSDGRRCGAGRGRAEPPATAADRGAGRLPRGARALHRGRSGGRELRGRGRRDRRARRARGLGQGGGRRSDRRAGDARLRARSGSPAPPLRPGLVADAAARASATCRAIATGAASCPSSRSPRT